MFIREYVTNNKTTKTKYITHRLVESYRTESGPKQRIILHLGEIALPKSEWPKLAAALQARLSGQYSLFEDEPSIAEAAKHAMEHYRFVKIKKEDDVQRKATADFVSVDLSTVAVCESRSLGTGLICHDTFNELEIGAILKDCGLSKKQVALAEAVILSRLISPCSDLASREWLLNRTALLELLPYDLKGIGKDLIYEIADILYANKDQIETSLREVEKRDYPAATTLFLYDLTNTYLEGSCENNSFAKRGKSKEKRLDCPLITLALVVDSAGFPVFSQIYSGNQSEPLTLTDILKKLMKDGQEILKEVKPIIVMDRGIATLDNMKLLKEAHYSYIVIERREVEKFYEKEFETAKETFEKILTSSDKKKKGIISKEESLSVYVKKIDIESGCRVLCLSEGREKKEQAMDKLKEERFLKDLENLRKSIGKKTIKLVEKVAERIGRLKQKYSSITKYYDIGLILDETQRNVINVTCLKKEIREQRSTLTGCYVIETDHSELSGSEIWHLYTTLTKVEGAFKHLKTDLGMRPVYHQLGDRSAAHLFISVLAYHILNTIEYKLNKTGDCRSFSTIKTILSTHQRTTVILTGEDSQIYHVRVSGTQESAHKEIYTALNIKDPLKRIKTLIGKRL